MKLRTMTASGNALKFGYERNGKRIPLIEMKQYGRRERQGGNLKSKSRGTALMDLGISRDQFRSGIGTAALVWPSDL
jgi:hypothetical protein